MAYTAAQIVNLVCQICNIPGRTAQVGQLLNVVLADYAQTMDLDVARKTTTFQITPQATIPYFWSLPADYLRFYDVFYNIDGTVFYLSEVPLKDLDRAYTADGISNYPDNFATDMSQSPPAMAFYPPPAIPLNITVRYRSQMADIATPETSNTIPWFPNQRVLIKDLCVEAADLCDDARKGDWAREVDKRMRKYLTMDDDKGGYSQTVQLGPRNFRQSGALPPSKKLGF